MTTTGSLSVVNPKGRVSRATRRHQVIQLLLGGRSEHEIAEHLGVREKTVRNIILHTLETWETQDKASIEQVRELQLKRIDQLVQAHWASALGVQPDGTRRNPSLKATAEIRQLEAPRSRIAGTEAPKRLEISGELGFTLEQSSIEAAEAAWAQSGGEVIDAEVIEDPAELPAGG